MQMQQNNCLAIIDTYSHDFFSNPTMVALLWELEKTNVTILLFTQRNNFDKHTGYKNLYLLDLPNQSSIYPRRPLKLFSFLQSYWNAAKIIKQHKVKQIIAIDAWGMLAAGRLQKLCRSTELNNISFEIFFKKELKAKFIQKLKEKEIEFAANVKSVLVQDKQRASNLQQENNFPPSAKWFFIPVSPNSKNIQVSKRINYKEKLGFDIDDKVLIQSGDVAVHTGMELIIDALKIGIPKPYKILIHYRKKLDATNPIHAQLIQLQSEKYPVIIHDNRFDTYDEYCSFVNSFDYGITFYKSEEHSFYNGKNLIDIGLSSGKFATYMMLDMPTVVTESNIYKELNAKYQFGEVISSAQDFVNVLATNKLQHIPENNCRKLYDEELFPGNRIREYVSFLKSVM